MALSGGGFKLAACGGGIALPVLLTVPVLEGADAPHAVCLEWLGIALGGPWHGGGLVFGLWPGGGGFVLIFDRGGGALMWRGGREFV